MYQKLVFLDVTPSIFQYGDRNSGPRLRNIRKRHKLKFVSKFSSPIPRRNNGGTCGQTLVSRTVSRKARRRKKIGTCVGFHSNSIHFTPQEKLWGRDESFYSNHGNKTRCERHKNVCEPKNLVTLTFGKYKNCSSNCGVHCPRGHPNKQTNKEDKRREYNTCYIHTVGPDVEYSICCLLGQTLIDARELEMFVNRMH
jgi:hypothetical protein